MENGFVPLCKEIYQTEMYRRIEVVWSFSCESRIGLVLDALVSDDQGLMCIEIQVPTASLAVNSAWVRVSQGVTELARQTREFSPEIEGLDVSLRERRGTTVAPVQPDDPRRGIGQPIAAHRHHHQPVGFCQAVHRGTDCFPATSERERQFWTH